jgi:DNA-binding MarR family transcriptional regulator
MGTDPSTMVSLVDQLEHAGLAQRRPLPEDRRAREILITPKGQRTLKRRASWRRRSKATSCRAYLPPSAASSSRFFERRSRQRSRCGAPRKVSSGKCHQLR